jgi:hypothetical protein
MGNYRPITDMWIMARPKVKYYGAYPSGFLGRARALLGVGMDDPVLHVCSGKIDEYPFDGLGYNDATADIDPGVEPDFVVDVRESLPACPDTPDGLWPAILADPPYTEDDAARYALGSEVFPQPNALLKLCLQNVRPGGKVGFLHYVVPRPPKKIGEHKTKFVACIGVMVGFGNRIRAYTVFEVVV